MKKQISLDRSRKLLLFYSWGAALTWTLVLLGLALFGRQDHLLHVRGNAINQARETFNKDLVFRRWVAGHGGVYVTPTPETPPNPYLSHLPKRDIATADGRPLTLINPAYMMRQVHELGFNQFGLRGHITSLKPLRPENRPDAWEEQALKAFAGGVKEVAEESLIKGHPFMRLMQPLYVEDRCLKCHEAQGYTVGQLRGGTSVSIDLSPSLVRHQQHMKKIFGLYLVLWLSGLLLMLFAFLYSRKQLLISEKNIVSLAAMRLRYENILSAAGEGIIGLNRDFVHDFVNPEALRMLGYSEAELLGLASHQSWHAFEAEASPYPLKECPIRLAMLNGKAVQNFRDQFKRKDGTFFPVEISVSPIDNNDMVQGVVVVFQDITARLEQEARTKRLSSIVEQTSGAVAVIGLDGIIEYVNHSYEVISGYSVNEMLGRHPKDLFFTEEKQDECQEFWQAIAQGRNWRGILASRRKDGAIVYEDTTGFPIFDDQGRIINYAAIKYDVSQAHKLQEQLFQAQKMEAVGSLASGVAHDFNNILTVINSVSETLISECAEDSEIRLDLVDINEAGQRAAVLTRQLLAFSRRQVIVLKDVSLRHLLVNLKKMMLRLLGEDIKLQFELPELENKIWVKADSGQFEQVIINLLVNARDALSPVEASVLKEIALRLEEVTLDDDFVALHEGSRAGAHALIEIKDNGCGMSREALSHCFEPFYTTKKLGQGTGLGLSTVYGIVKQNDGYISIYSEPGHGTTIQIYWPLIAEEGGLLETGIKTVEVDVSRFKGATILLVEDDSKIREIAASQLRKAGLQVITASDGREALAKIKVVEKAPDLLFTDMVMPVMGGPELSRSLKESYPDLPVLFSSGYTDKALVKALGEGEDFLQKPYTASVLLVKIAGLLEGRFEVDKDGGN